MADGIVDVVDLKPALIDAKKNGCLYYLTDTHWNPTGAYVASQSIASYLSRWYPNIRPESIGNCIVKGTAYTGDLAAFACLNGELTEHVNTIQEKQNSVHFMGPSGVPLNSPRIRIDVLRSKNANAQIPKVVMFRDSFATDIIPHLAPHFRECAYFLGRLRPRRRR